MSSTCPFLQIIEPLDGRAVAIQLALLYWWYSSLQSLWLLPNKVLVPWKQYFREWNYNKSWRTVPWSDREIQINWNRFHSHVPASVHEGIIIAIVYWFFTPSWFSSNPESTPKSIWNPSYLKLDEIKIHCKDTFGLGVWFFLRQGLTIELWMSWNSLLKPGWPWTQSSTFSAFLVLG